jgi:hypothetical protein
MPKAGPCRFALSKPIAAKKGDLLGLYIPDEGTHVAAVQSGRMLFLEGRGPTERTPLGAWQSEPKSVIVSAVNAAEVAKPPENLPAAGIVLQEFPEAKLTFRLYDLAEKKVVAEGDFTGTCNLTVPGQGRHFFLLVRDQQG